MPRRLRYRAALFTFLVPVALVSCRETPAGPAEPRVSLAVFGDPIVYVAVGAAQTEPLHVAAVDATSGAPLRGIKVEWQVSSGGGSLTAATSDTDSHGVAATALRPGASGLHRVTAKAPRLVGAAPEIEVRVVAQPAIQSIEPQVVPAGGEVTVTGSGFSAAADQNAVYFDGIRGAVLSATTTQLRVRVPACLPARDVQVTVGLGAVVSSPRTVTTGGGTDAVLALAPGQVRTFTDPAELSCVRLPGGHAGSIYVVVVHNTAQALVPPAPFEFRSLTPRTPAAAVELRAPAPTEAWADAWERNLRRDEAQFREDARSRLLSPQAAAAALPAVGSAREFSVLNKDGGFSKVGATVRAVTNRAIIYVDTAAAAVMTADDVAYYGQVFDDPIYSGTTGVFGQPSDTDGNERVIILFTPRVNELTPRNENSFVAGFFYGCDLVARSRCSGSNLAEVFYSVVPDPTGRWSDARTQATVRAAVPPVMAHEFQHMIHFASRGNSSDVLWLSEALAHTAEEIVGEILLGRGQAAQAAPFRSANLQRAQRYLSATASTSLVGDESPGSLELRGGGWLFLKYLRGHYGGNDLLRRLTHTTRSGVANVVHETAQPWATLVTDFGMALWADGAPQLRGPLDARYHFVDFDLRTSLGTIPGSFTLSPPVLGWRDFAVAGNLAAAAQQYFGLIAPADGSGLPLNLVLAGHRGAPFTASSAVRFSVLRVS